MGGLTLPVGFSAEELLCVLDHDGDGFLQHDEFIHSFYRLVDGGTFQQMCIVQAGINSLRRVLIKGQSQQANMWKRVERIEARLESAFAAGIEASQDSLTPEPKFVLQVSPF